eukprot:TRINITY_DN11605_c1_g1_i3.p1 TRINITY_DN11605_c1_g1~~TRINITY_DN11605_c1_g1_i3.p1  ORF type:complete len:949 (-),score=207.95 TRINITY_DN11605_c1_g1_i3:149-2995(-)
MGWGRFAIGSVCLFSLLPDHGVGGVDVISPGPRPRPRLQLRQRLGSRTSRQERVVKAFQHAWTGYKTYCWGKDELLPVSQNCSNQFGGMGAQIVDALDSLLLMGLDQEYDDARRWVVQNFSAAGDFQASVFETVIRFLGGLLSAHYLTGGDTELLRHAAELGERLLPAWREGPIPFELINLATGEVAQNDAALGSSLAEVGSLQLEFSSLSAALGDPRFHWRGEHVMGLLGPLLEKAGGLLPIMLKSNMPLRWTNPRVTLGGRGDSFYEYLLKQWLLTNRTEERYRAWYQMSVSAIRRSMVGRSAPSNVTFVREVSSIQQLRLRPDDERWKALDETLNQTTPGHMFVLMNSGQQDAVSEDHIVEWGMPNADDMTEGIDLSFFFQPGKKNEQDDEEPEDGKEAGEHVIRLEFGALSVTATRTLNPVQEKETKEDGDLAGETEKERKNTNDEQGMESEKGKENDKAVENETEDAEENDKEVEKTSEQNEENEEDKEKERKKERGKEKEKEKEQEEEKVKEKEDANAKVIAEEDEKENKEEQGKVEKLTQKESGEKNKKENECATDEGMESNVKVERKINDVEKESQSEVKEMETKGKVEQEDSATLWEQGECEENDEQEGNEGEEDDNGMCAAENDVIGNKPKFPLVSETQAQSSAMCDPSAVGQIQGLQGLLMALLGANAGVQQSRRVVMAKLVSVEVAAMSHEEVCEAAEVFLSERWDLAHRFVNISDKGDEPLPESVLHQISALLGPDLWRQCHGAGYFKMDHLVCFLPGTLALGVMSNASIDTIGDLRLAEELMEACARMWHDSPLGLAPEAVEWNVLPGRDRKDMEIFPAGSYSMLRPETVESLWYVYRATRNQKYQDWGWKIFEAIELHARISTGGYAGVEDVRETDEPHMRDRMETFLLSETFKYLFLLFADGDEEPLLDFSRVVLNTEGHALPVVSTDRMYA